jgi:hypothetical protein
MRARREVPDRPCELIPAEAAAAETPLTLDTHRPRGGSGTLTFTLADRASLSPSHETLCRVIVEASGFDSHDVFEVRVSEAVVELDVVDFLDPNWPVHTVTVRPVQALAEPRAEIPDLPERNGAASPPDEPMARAARGSRPRQHR